jgi:hypothetical protein
VATSSATTSGVTALGVAEVKTLMWYGRSRWRRAAPRIEAARFDSHQILGRRHRRVARQVVPPIENRAGHRSVRPPLPIGVAGWAVAKGIEATRFRHRDPVRDQRPWRE